MARFYSSRTQVLKGLVYPFVFVIIGIKGIIEFPKFTELELTIGTVWMKDPPSRLILDENRKIFYISTEWDERVDTIVKKDMNVRIWAMEKDLIQLEVEGNVILKYEESKYKNNQYSYIFIIIGLIQIPFVFFTGRKALREGEEDDIISDALNGRYPDCNDDIQRIKKERVRDLLGVKKYFLRNRKDKKGVKARRKEVDKEYRRKIIECIEQYRRENS